MSIKIGIYCRKSSGIEKDNVSIKIQKENGIKFCKKNKYEFEIFEEIVSGGSLERDEYNKMITQCRDGLLNGIWVFKYDRLERNLESYVMFRKLCRELNMILYVGNEEYNLNESGDRLNVGFRSMFGEYERERIKERMITGKENKLKNGLDIIGNIGFGLIRDNGVIKVDENNRKWVERIYRTFLYKNIKSYNDVYNRLIKKYDDLNNKITLPLIVKILNNKRYNGIREYEFNDKKYRFEFEKIISDDDFIKVQEKIKHLKSLRKGNLKNDYLLKGKVKCECCKDNMWIIGSKSKVSNGFKYYRYFVCNQGKKEEKKYFNNRENYDGIVDCESIKGNKISVTKLENVVWLILFDVMGKSEFILNELKEKYSDNRVMFKSLEGKNKYYEKKIEENKNEIKKVIKLCVKNGIDLEDEMIEEYKEEELKMKTRIIENNEILENLNLLENKELINNRIQDDLSVLFEDKSISNKKNLINKYIQEVYVERLNSKVKNVEYNIKVKFKVEDILKGEKLLDNIQNENQDKFYILNSKDLEVW